MRRYLSLNEIGRRLGKEVTWMHRHVKRLIQKHGFPARDDAMGGWDEGAITAWQNARLAPELRRALGIAEPAEAVTVQLALPPVEDDLDLLAAELDQRADALFAGRAA